MPDVSSRQPKALPPMAMATWTNPNIWVPNPPRQTRIVSIGIERSSLSREKGLPLPISQPKGHLWRSTPNSRKSTEEEVNCDATADSCSVLSWFLIHEHLCHAYIISCGGAGFVRICTMRVEPDFSKDDSVAANFTVQIQSDES